MIAAGGRCIVAHTAMSTLLLWNAVASSILAVDLSFSSRTVNASQTVATYTEAVRCLHKSACVQLAIKQLLLCIL
jgi:hypothetical protein